MAAGQYFDPRQQFGKRIRFWQIVIAAGAQTLDTVIDLSQGREDKHGGTVALLTQRAD